MKKEEDLFYDLFDSPIGPLWIVSVQAGLAYLLWHRSEAAMRAELRDRTGRHPKKSARYAKPWRSSLKRYFSGEQVVFREAIAFLEGTPFQHAVWQNLMHIPYGKVSTYRSVSQKLNKPSAARAVGNACGKNPLPIVVPCHRVVREDGTLGGYTGGIGIKTHLLKIEGVL